MYVTAIVLAAGKGKRFSHSGKSQTHKLLAEINSQPIIIYSLNVLSSHPLVKDIIVVANAKTSAGILKKISQYKIDKILQVVKGGRLRQDSVFNGLRAMNIKTDLVLIHDAARPFIDKKLVSSVIRQAQTNSAAIAGVPMKATIKKIKNLFVEKTIDRDNLWEIQTPQAFKKALILKAYNKFGELEVTDDSMLVEKLGAKVNVVLGSYVNIKITTPEDLILAEAILNNRLRS